MHDWVGGREDVGDKSILLCLDCSSPISNISMFEILQRGSRLFQTVENLKKSRMLFALPCLLPV